MIPERGRDISIMLVELKDLTKTYTGRDGNVRAVDGISLSVDTGQFLSLQGPSGCGKSTLLLMSGGLLAPESGTGEGGGENTYAMNPNARSAFRARNIGFVFQQFHLVPYLTVLENVLAPSIATGGTDGMDQARELVSQFGLDDRSGHVPGELSSGERQRTALARALFNRPKLLLADEPTGNLDYENSQTVLKYLREFVTDGGAVLLVTHDPVAAEQADRAIQLRDGRIEGS